MERLNKLDASTKPLWGKMNAPQMLAHLNVAYEMLYDGIHKKPRAFMRFILKAMVKPTVCGPKPYPKNSRTAPQFIIADERDFEKEKARLTAYLDKVVAEGGSAFEGRESNSFGRLTADEWNTMFYKHADHHLTQFGV